MANLRLIDAKSVESRIIKAKFTSDVTTNLTVDNVSVESRQSGYPDGEVLSIAVNGPMVTINTLPLTPLGQYKVTFKSTISNPFISADGKYKVLEDGKTNVKNIIGAENPENPIRNNLVLQLKDNIYNLARGTFVRDILNQISTGMLKARYDIGQTKNDNYLSFTVVDEEKRRGYGPYDHLNEEGAYEVVRVGKSPTDATLDGQMAFNRFPFDIITLQGQETSETLDAANSGSGTFKELLLTLTNYPVTIVKSITINYNGVGSYVYDINSLGYRLRSSKYDTVKASTLFTLEYNQVLLNDVIFEDPNFVVPGVGDTITINYQFKSLGRNIDPESVEVVQILEAVREATPALTNQFSLKYAPVVNNNGNIVSSNGVEFLDPSSVTPFLSVHPAFTKELPFRLESLPARPGEYSIDYEVSKVYVFGEDDRGLGTGYFPPAVNYKYLKTYRNELDYTYDPDFSDLVSNPLRELTDKTARIRYKFQQNLVPGIDYNELIHKESIDERIGNKINSLNCVSAENAPITNVFRIYNETSQEQYALTRFHENKIYFTYNTPPNIEESKKERANFKLINNELLVRTNEVINLLGTKVFIVKLLSQNIMAATEDAIGSSFNTSIDFSRKDLFVTELYYDSQILTVNDNIDKLNIGDYQVDYYNGYVYVGVSGTQVMDIGTVSYRAPVIVPENPHIISVSNVYYSIGNAVDLSKFLSYESFGDGWVTPSILARTDERFLNGDQSNPYMYDNGVIEVSQDIRLVRGIYDVHDLSNSVEPVNFGPSSTFSGNVITMDSIGIERREALVVLSGLELDVSILSPGIEIGTAVSVIRDSDGQELLDGLETISGNTITLSGSSGAVVGDSVEVIYTVVLNGSSTPVVDYDKGGYYIDYSYLADEILISYEHGDNALDFRESRALNEGERYFVTYKAGALRDALLDNFGSLINMPEFKSFDIEFDREIYRGALIGALQSFLKGPTIPSMEQIISNVTRITPEIIEAAFKVWSLGYSRLYPENIVVGGDLQLVPGKFDNGILPMNEGEYVSFPVVGNLRLEEGTLETWVIPEWNGIDNDATVEFSILLNGVSVSDSDVFIGSSAYHPEIKDGKFSLNRYDDDCAGVPANIAIDGDPGIYVYYDLDDESWKFLAKDDPANANVYSGKIRNSGEFYNVKFIPGTNNVGDVLRSDNDLIDFSFDFSNDTLDGYGDGYAGAHSFDGITFMADNPHYLFDFGSDKDKNRFSLYKDGRGYLNFTVWDNGPTLLQNKKRRNSYTVSADISGWRAGQKHFVAISWRLSSSDGQDEMHLFIDGLEVPNILLYGGRPKASITDRFRTVVPELIVGTVTKPSIAGNDMITSIGVADVVSPGNDFTTAGILAGDIIVINEPTFGQYNILSVSGDTLTLDASMPATLENARFSINPFSNIVSSHINLYKNIAVYVVRGGEEIEIPGLRADIPGYSISKNSFNEDVLTILGDVLPGDSVYVKTLGLNYRRTRDRVFMWGDVQSVLKTHLPPPISLDETVIRKVITEITPIGPGNSTIVGSNFEANIGYTQPTNITEGRRLTVRVTGGNVDFTTPTVVTITGNIVEALSFTEPGEKTTSGKFDSISDIEVVTKPLSLLIDGTAVEVKEAYPVTYPDGNNDYPVIRYAFKTQGGTTLTGVGNVVTDLNGLFLDSDVGNLIVVDAPSAGAGTYTITSRVDNTSVEVSPTPSNFSASTYSVYNVSIGRSGFQNGFFFLEKAGTASTPYPLTEGVYEFDFSSYLDIKFDPFGKQIAYIGSDFNGKNQARAIMDEFRILSRMLTDTRVGESVTELDESVTIDYNSISEFRKNDDTLMLLHFNSRPFTNDSSYVVMSNNEFYSSAESVNARFGRSIVITDRGLDYNNDGMLTNNEGTIEFWVSPRYDTYNDPNIRMYFDATSAVVEDKISLTTTTVQVDGNISQVLSVRLLSDANETGEEYFSGGQILPDRRTIRLKKPLPYSSVPVKVTYIPSGISGDRISIFKDYEGFITFNVRASGQDFQVRQPVFWSRNTWHRICASYKFNTPNGKDFIRLFVDREEKGMVLFGSGIIFGTGVVFGQGKVNPNNMLIDNIDFKDYITKFYIGQTYSGTMFAQARMDNLKLSDIARNPINIGDQYIDPNYTNNLDLVFPVIEDAYTTFLLDFTHLRYITDDFSILRDSQFGIYNFTINIIDSFRIIESSERVKNLVESMIYALKPATSKVQINYGR